MPHSLLNSLANFGPQRRAPRAPRPFVSLVLSFVALAAPAAAQRTPDNPALSGPSRNGVAGSAPNAHPYDGPLLFGAGNSGGWRSGSDRSDTRGSEGSDSDASSFGDDSFNGEPGVGNDDDGFGNDGLARTP